MSETTAWWRDAVIYQLYPRSFMDSNNDGIGDLNGIISKLDYLNDGTETSLGIDAIWLNPVYPSPQYDFGYDIINHCDIDPQYGTMEDFERLLKEAHSRGIRVIMDYVPSVTSHLNPWFLESRSSRTNPKRDWYIWKETKGRGIYPNNWMGFFGGRAWEWDNKTQSYYYHNSLPEQPDLNWRNPEVEKAMLDVVRFWFEKGVDGFRIDVLNYAYKDRYLRSNPLCIGRRPYEMQRHIHDKDLPEAYGLAGKLRAVAEEYGDRMLVAEIFSPDIDFACGFLGDDNDGVHMVFNFSFMNAGFSAPRLRDEILKSENTFGRKGWPAYFLSNHDHVRHITRFEKGGFASEKAFVSAALILTLRGTPFIYMGEEIGMKEGRLKRHEIMDPPGRRYWPFFKGRDGARTPMQWNRAEYSGFSSTKPWLRVNPDYAHLNVEFQSVNPDSLLNHYRKLIRLRKDHAALRCGSLKMLDSHPDVLAYMREGKSENLAVCLNFSNEVRTVTIKGFESRKAVRIFSYPYISAPEISCSRITVPPYGVMIIAV